MTFSEKAVSVCVEAMRRGKVSGRHVQRVLQCRDVEVSSIEPFLDSPNDQVRRHAIRIVGKKGDPAALEKRARIEEEKTVLIEILGFLGERAYRDVENLVYLLQTDDGVMKQAVVQMLRRTNPDLLMPALFDPDDSVVERAKRYINEQKD